MEYTVSTLGKIRTKHYITFKAEMETGTSGFLLKKVCHGSYGVCVCVCVCVCVFTVAVACWSPSQPFPYEESSELIDRSSGRAETTSHTTHRDSEATPPQVTSRTYLLLLGEQGIDTHKRLAHLPRRARDSNPGPLSCEPNVIITTIHGVCVCVCVCVLQ